MVRRLSLSWLPSVIRRPGFWLILVILVLITIPHYSEAIKPPAFLAHTWENLGLDRHAFERILYLVPIILGGFLFGQRGAIVVSLVALACMLPRAIFISEHPTDAIFETVGVFVVGTVLALSFGSLRKERERRIQFSVLNEISGVVSQSLELGQVLSSSIDSVIDVMKVDAAMVFLLNKEAGELAVAAQRGLSSRFVQSISRIKFGQGFNGRVAETGEPLFVEDVSQDPSVTKVAVVGEGIKAQLIVPLKSKGKVVGTLCAAMHSSRRFRQDEVELLTAIGNQIGVAVENARLYEQEKEVTKQMRASEERLTRLNTISTVLAESLELEQVLHKAIDMVMKIMEVDVGLIFSLEEGSQELVLMAYEGVSEKFAESVTRTKVGEGFNGIVARTGEPLIVKDVTIDPASYVPQIKEMKIESEVIVPMSFRGRIVGTIWIAQRRPRDFLPEDVNLLTALGSQIANSIANARLYEEQREVTEQLRVSEERYRELFENANDAIWVHDLEGNIIAA
ncbi:MAG: GAF domain-containing protein, partial [Chloroflexi bacterium]|nr:GAF domain-containing protein [Chloroflexota bacterium]